MKKTVHTITSKILGRQTRVCLLTPDGDKPATRLLYLLHGNGDDCTSWVDYSDIEEYVQGRDVAVVMPEVENSYFTDMAKGPAYFSYMSQELPKLCAEWLGKTYTPEHTYTAGLSAGGYGALKWAMTFPDMFAACACLSGSVDIAGRIKLLPESRLGEFRVIHGDELIIAPENDLHGLTKTAAAQNCKTRIYLACGQQDSFIALNREYEKLLDSLDFEYEYKEGSGGHSWSFWNKWIVPALGYMLGE